VDRAMQKLIPMCEHGFAKPEDATAVQECSAAIRMRPRVASPEMLPEGGTLPHLICSPPQLGGGGSDEAGEHGNAR